MDGVNNTILTANEMTGVNNTILTADKMTGVNNTILTTDEMACVNDTILPSNEVTDVQYMLAVTASINQEQEPRYFDQPWGEEHASWAAGPVDLSVAGGGPDLGIPMDLAAEDFGVTAQDMGDITAFWGAGEVDLSGAGFGEGDSGRVVALD